jgi:hypothetical protein
MRTTISFQGSAFPPSFGYLEAYLACEEMNAEKPTWNLMLQFDATSNFSFSSFNVTSNELVAVVMAKITPLYGPPQLPACEFPEGKGMALAPMQQTHLPPEIWGVEQLY